MNMNAEIERFKEKIVSIRQKLYLTALKYMQQKEDAEDVVQEALLRLWNIRGQLESVSKPEAFAMQTTINICIDRLRAQRETTEATDYNLKTYSETPYSDLERKDAVHLVKQIIERLPELQKIVIRMRDVEGYELQDIAEITGTQISAVTVNLSRARKKVREEFIKANNFYSNITQ
jgi:RNA polymerase sigma-70 factor (ECF subfamily)